MRIHGNIFARAKIFCEPMECCDADVQVDEECGFTPGALANETSKQEMINGQQ